MSESRAMLQPNAAFGQGWAESYTDLTDDLLVTRAVNGSREAFGELTRRYRPLAVKTAASIIGSDDAEDVVQDALILAFRALAMLQDRHRFPQWLGTITRYRALRIGRREGRRAAGLVAIDTFQGDLPARAGDASEEDASDVPRLEAALLHIPQAFATVLRLHFLEGVPHQEIAERLGVSLSTSKWRCYRGKQLLRALLRTEDRTKTFVERACERCRDGSVGVSCEERFGGGAESRTAPRGGLPETEGGRGLARFPRRLPTFRDDLPPRN